MSGLLKGFGIKRDDIRFPEGPLKGYWLKDCEEAFARYLPPLQPATARQATVPAPSGGTGVATGGPAVAGRERPEAGHSATCSGVADRERPEARDSATCCGVAGHEGVAGEEVTQPQPAASSTGEAGSGEVATALAALKASLDARRETDAGGGPAEAGDARRDDD